MIDWPDDETLLARFRQWLHQTRSEADDPTLATEEGPPADGEGRAVGLYRLVEEFTALRHELKLQTKSTRGLQEQAEALLRAMQQAIEQSGTLDREKIAQTLRTGKFDTILGNYEYDERGANKQQLSFVAQVQDGKRVIVWPKEVAKAQAKLVK